MDLELSVDDIYDDIKKSMKQIIQQTNDILKDSQNAFKKVKEKMVDLERLELTPTDNVKEWFLEKNHTKFTIPDLFELLFSSTYNKLEFNTKSIVLCQGDATVFGFTPNTPISIYEIFERLPTYFQ
jgi:hypothetical protein